jgi:hypothetical protein
MNYFSGLPLGPLASTTFFSMLNYFEKIITRKKLDRYGNRMETQEIINSRGKNQNQFSKIDLQKNIHHQPDL